MIYKNPKKQDAWKWYISGRLVGMGKDDPLTFPMLDFIEKTLTEEFEKHWLRNEEIKREQLRAVNFESLIEFKKEQFHNNKLRILFRRIKEYSELEQLIHDKLKESPPNTLYLLNRLCFLSFGDAINMWVNLKKVSIFEIKKVSKNKEIEKVCGLREEYFNPQMPFELDYYCPICSETPVHLELDNDIDFFEMIKLQWSEYKYHMWCENCNIDIASFLCLNSFNLEALEIYEQRFLNLINEIKLDESNRIKEEINILIETEPFLKVINKNYIKNLFYYIFRKDNKNIINNS